VTTAYINRIATGVPAHDVHDVFVGFARVLLGQDAYANERFERMAKMANIAHRYSCIDPVGGFYAYGKFPSTAERMRAFAVHAPELAAATVERLDLGPDRDLITHVLITCCTGFSAPGLDFDLIERCGLPSSVERVIIGFMGCHAAINALKLARHIVRSEPDARVLVLNIELCTLHLRETTDLEEMLGFLLFADGCAACLVTAEPQGVALDSFRAVLVPDAKELITWHIRDSGFEMFLSPRVPGVIRRAIKASAGEILSGEAPSSIDLWAVHPGGTSVIDAVQRAFGIGPKAVSASRDVLHRFGNMSSATVMFVLDAMLRSTLPGASGCAMSFGPGMVAETMRFRMMGETS
jgi:predicted naringenin-chalcone synthase